MTPIHFLLSFLFLGSISLDLLFRLRAVPLQSVESKLGRTGESEWPRGKLERCGKNFRNRLMEIAPHLVASIMTKFNRFYGSV